VFLRTFDLGRIRSSGVKLTVKYSAWSSSINESLEVHDEMSVNRLMQCMLFVKQNMI
jgi:hypothetical protein